MMVGCKRHSYIVCFLSIILIVFSFPMFFHIEGEKNDNPSVSLPIEEEKTIITTWREETKNPDVIGVVRIPKTNINEVVVQGKDNEYYLNYNEKRKKDIRGAIFLDYRVNEDSRKKLIYGHNSSTLEVPFKELENYYKQDFYKEHPTIELEMEEGVKTYQIFSVFIETEDWSYMNLAYPTDDIWYQHLTYLKNKSFYDTGVDVEKEDKILILQTCSHHKKYKNYKNKYLLVIAKEI